MPTLYELFPDIVPLTMVNVGAPYMFENSPLNEALKLGKIHYTGFETISPEGEAPSPYISRTSVIVADGSPRKLYCTHNIFCTSLYEPDLELQNMFQNLAKLCTVEQELNVKTERLDTLCESLPSVDFLRIDVQGSEIDCLENAETVLKSTSFVEVKVSFVPIYKKQALWGDVDSFLQDRGFTFHCWDHPEGRSFKPVMSLKCGYSGFRQVLYTKAWYVRHFEDFSHLEPTKLTRLAVLLNDTLRSIDLAHRALFIADEKTGGHMAKDYLHNQSEYASIV